MKLALVVDWPAIDVKEGDETFPFSAWEWTVTSELMKQSGFKPSLILPAFPRHVVNYKALWEGGKIGSTLTQDAADAAEAVRTKLAGYDLCLTLGPHAMYILTGETKIDVFRGTHIDSPSVPGLQVVPSYSPHVFCQTAWHERPVVVSAMHKAQTRFVDRDRTIYVPETTADLYWFSTKFIKNEMAFDVETNKQRRITEFSISPRSDVCLYVYLEDENHRSLWSEADELDIFLWLDFLAKRTDLSWGFHNATYDLSYLDTVGIRPRGHIFDTMLRNHAWQPEWEKSLGFLSALHLPTRAWKHWRTKPKADFNKAGAI